MSSSEQEKTDMLILGFLHQHEGRWCTWGKGYTMPTIQDAMPEETPLEYQLVKMKELIERGLVDGCFCGCRGDFTITTKGMETLLQWRSKKQNHLAPVPEGDKYRVAIKVDDNEPFVPDNLVEAGMLYGKRETTTGSIRSFDVSTGVARTHYTHNGMEVDMYYRTGRWANPPPGADYNYLFIVSEALLLLPAGEGPGNECA